MFSNHKHTFALATAIGSLGGFQDPPEWFKSASKSSIWQVLMLAVLVYQGGGQLDFSYSLVVAILFYLFVSLTGYVSFSTVSDSEGDGDESGNIESFESEEDFEVPSLGEEFAEHGDESFMGDESFIGDESFTAGDESFTADDEENFDVIQNNESAPENNTEGFSNDPVALNESSSTFANFS